MGWGRYEGVRSTVLDGPEVAAYLGNDVGGSRAWPSCATDEARTCGAFDPGGCPSQGSKIALLGRWMEGRMEIDGCHRGRAAGIVSIG